MDNDMNYVIRKATGADVPAICALAKSQSLAVMEEQLTREELEDRGFLVSDYTAKDYLRLLRRHPNSYVLVADGRIRAFLLGQDERELELGKMVNMEILAQSDTPFAVIKQIFVDPEHSGKGYGRALYQHFIKEVRRDVYAAVVMDLKLENRGSAAFHHKLGFERMLEVCCEDGLTRWVFCRAWGTEGGDTCG